MKIYKKDYRHKKPVPKISTFEEFSKR